LISIYRLLLFELLLDFCLLFDLPLAISDASSSALRCFDISFACPVSLTC
jgi:hypothetical protein